MAPLHTNFPVKYLIHMIINDWLLMQLIVEFERVGAMDECKEVGVWFQLYLSLAETL